MGKFKAVLITDNCIDFYNKVPNEFLNENIKSDIRLGYEYEEEMIEEIIDNYCSSDRDTIISNLNLLHNRQSVELFVQAINDYDCLFQEVVMANIKEMTAEQFYQYLSTNYNSSILKHCYMYSDEDKAFNVDYGTINATIRQDDFDDRIIVDDMVSIYDNQGNKIVDEFDMSKSYDKKGER